MEKTEKFRMRKYFEKTETNIYAAPTCITFYSNAESHNLPLVDLKIVY